MTKYGLVLEQCLKHGVLDLSDPRYVTFIKRLVSEASLEEWTSKKASMSNLVPLTKCEQVDKGYALIKQKGKTSLTTFGYIPLPLHNSITKVKVPIEVPNVDFVVMIPKSGLVKRLYN